MSGLVMTEEVAEPVSQQVVLKGRETSFTLHGYSVDIHPSQASSLGSEAAGSSKVKITTITNQNWELPKGRGTIVASNDQYLAYVLEGKSGYVLRLLQPETSNRALLKGFVGGVLDVAFAHRGSSLLAAVDEGGNVYLWDLSKVEDITKAPSDALCVVLQRDYKVDETPHRLVWSPHVGVEEGEECLVVSHGSDVDVIDVRAVIATVPSGMKIASKKLEKGITTLPAVHSLDVTDLSLSPDGQVLATCGEDGVLKFWSLSEKRCLHELNPHHGRLVTRLIFCDNHISQDPSNQFWRFLLTASGTELKLWCTVSWKCLQTIRFCTTPSGPTPHILLNLDLSASYLVVTDAMRAAVYVMQLVADDTTGTASLTSITEYLLKQPIFSFIVPGHASLLGVDVSMGSSDSEDEDNESPQRDARLNTVGIKLHTVHSKSMQELEIKFEPPDLMGVPPPDEPVGVADPLPPTTQPVGVADPLLPTTQPVGLADPLRPTTQPSSLPTLSAAHSDFSTSFHSLTDTGSPKLLTPAQFLSPNKSDLFLPSPRDFETTPTKHSTSDLASVTVETLSADEAESKHTEVNSDRLNPQDDILMPEIPRLESEDGSPSEVTTPMPHPLMSAHSQEEDPTSSEFVNIPKSVVEVINDGTIVTASPITLPVFRHQRVHSLGDSPSPDAVEEKGPWPDIGQQRVHSLGDSPSPDAVEEKGPWPDIGQQRVHSLGDSPSPDAVEEKGPWPDIGQHELPTKIVSKDQDMSSLLSTPSSVYSAPVVGGGASVYDSPFVGGGASVYDSPIVGGGASVYDNPIVRGGSTFVSDPVNNEEILLSPEETLVVEEVISSSDSDPPVAAKEELIAVEETPAISQDSPPALVINEEVPPVMIEDLLDLPVINHEPPLLQVVDSGTELTMPSGSIETTLEAFNTPKLDLAGESHDQVVESHDQPAAVSSNEQLEVKRRPRSRRRRRKKKSTGGVVNSESDGEISESVSSIENAGDLLAIIAKQQEEIVKLRKEQELFRSGLEGKLDALMNQQAANVKELVKEQDARLDRVLREKSSSDKVRADKLASTLTTSLTGAVKNKLDHLVKSEMKSIILPSLQRSMTTIQNDLSANMAQRVEAALRDGVNQILHIGGLSEAIGGAVANSLQRMVAARYEEVFKSLVLPGFEKGCQEMFRQIDEAFRRGTTEYIGQLSGHNRQLVEMTLQQVTLTVNSLASQGSPLTAQVQSVVKQEMATTQQNIQQMVVEGVASSVAKEIAEAFKEHYQASPEARQEEGRKRKEEEITRLVGDQQFNSAFEQALSTSDLKLVMYLCGQVNADFVFEKTPCPLSQPVLLSLIQQLSVELHDQLELKIKYLEHSLLALDIGSDVTKSHMTPVVSQLSQQLSSLEQTFVSTPSLATPTLTKLVKRLKMMAQHLTAQ